MIAPNGGAAGEEHQLTQVTLRCRPAVVRARVRADACGPASSGEDDGGGWVDLGLPLDA